MTLLSTMQYFCNRQNLTSPASVMGTTDPQIKQARAILEEEGNDLSRRHNWEVLTQEATLTTLAAESQGAVKTIATNGYRKMKNNTIWDRTDKLPVLGPMDAQEWQTLKAVVSTGPRYRYRIRGGNLLVNPAPVAGHAWYFEYVSFNWILGADAVTYKQYFTLDTDTILLPEDLLLMGMRWRWKKEKGFDYSEDFRTYEMQVKDAMGSDGSKPIIRMDDQSWDGPKPGVFIPSGSWNLP